MRGGQIDRGVVVVYLVVSEEFALCHPPLLFHPDRESLEYLQLAGEVLHELWGLRPELLPPELRLLVAGLPGPDSLPVRKGRIPSLRLLGGCVPFNTVWVVFRAVGLC
jgi:hypothetical protein